MSKRKSNKRVKQMICDVLQYKKPTDTFYGYEFGTYWVFDGMDGFGMIPRLQPYCLCIDGKPIKLGVVSIRGKL